MSEHSEDGERGLGGHGGDSPGGVSGPPEHREGDGDQDVEGGPREHGGPNEGVEASGHPRQRRPATVEEAKALAHPLRVRIVLLCSQEELTNKQLADRLGRDPATLHYHVRQLVDAGFLEPAPVRAGASGALEKPYRSTGRSWWLEDPLASAGPAVRLTPVEAFFDGLRLAGPDALTAFARFTLHLSPEDAEALERRILAILDEYVETDADRREHPAHTGVVVLHRLAPQEDGDPTA